MCGIIEISNFSVGNNFDKKLKLVGSLRRMVEDTGCSSPNFEISCPNQMTNCYQVIFAAAGMARQAFDVACRQVQQPRALQCS